MTAKNETALDRMRRLDAGTPPTETESRDYIREKKLQEGLTILGRINRRLDLTIEQSDACVEILEASNARYEARRLPDSLPMRRSNLLWWLLVLVTFAALSGSVFQASYVSAQSPAVNVCIEALVEDITPALMSSTTANRKARSICNGLRRMAPAFFRAPTQ